MKIDERQKEQNNLLTDMKHQQEKILDELNVLNRTLTKIFGTVVQPTEGKWYLYVFIGLCQKRPKNILLISLVLTLDE